MESMRGRPVAGDMVTAASVPRRYCVAARCEVRIGPRVKSSPSLSLLGLLSRSKYNVDEWLDQVEAIACRGAIICVWLVDGWWMGSGCCHRKPPTRLIRAVHARPTAHTQQPRACSLLHQPLMLPTDCPFYHPITHCLTSTIVFPLKARTVFYLMVRTLQLQHVSAQYQPTVFLNTACRDRHAKARALLVVVI